MIKNYEIELNLNVALGSRSNSNDECNMLIKTRSANVDEIFDQLIKTQDTLENINFLLKGVESITYSFTKVIVKNTFVESPDWIKNKKMYNQPTK